MKLLSKILVFLMLGLASTEYLTSEAFAKESDKTKKVKKVKKVKKYKKKKKRYRWVRASSKVNRYIDGDKLKLESMIKDLHE